MLIWSDPLDGKAVHLLLLWQDIVLVPVCEEARGHAHGPEVQSGGV